MTSISASLIAQCLFTRIDINANGCVTKDEFLSGRPGEVSESQASAFFDTLDADGSGDVSQTELSDGLTAKAQGGAAGLTGPLSSDVLNAVLSLTQQGSETSTSDAPSSCGGGGGSGSGSDEVYDPLDTNKDGVVDLQELMAALGSEDANGGDQSENDLTARLVQQIEKATRAYGSQTSEAGGLGTSLLIDA
jgi:Ca2+-binding EF-hand superfamily protein